MQYYELKTCNERSYSLYLVEKILPYRQFGSIMPEPQVVTCGYENKSFQDKLLNWLEKSPGPDSYRDRDS